MTPAMADLAMADPAMADPALANPALAPVMVYQGLQKKAK